MWCATPNARYWSFATDGPVPPEKIAALPKKKGEKTGDECRTDRRAFLQPAHNERGKPDSDTDENDGARPIDKRIAATLELHRRIGQRDAPVQFRHERGIGPVEPFVLEHALRRCGDDLKLRKAFRPDLGDETVPLHAAGAIGHAQSPDAIKRNVGGAASYDPLEAAAGQAEFARRAKQGGLIAV
jgi:hypothetical protein